jgi:hypothetical protein
MEHSARLVRIEALPIGCRRQRIGRVSRIRLVSQTGLASRTELVSQTALVSRTEVGIPFALRPHCSHREKAAETTVKQ